MSIVTPEALEAYLEAFRAIVAEYPERWHLCAVAEGKRMSERFPEACPHQMQNPRTNTVRNAVVGRLT